MGGRTDGWMDGRCIDEMDEFFFLDYSYWLKFLRRLNVFFYIDIVLLNFCVD